MAQGWVVWASLAMWFEIVAWCEEGPTGVCVQADRLEKAWLDADTQYVGGAGGAWKGVVQPTIRLHRPSGGSASAAASWVVWTGGKGGWDGRGW